jgi:signal transduction histidine kinase
MIKGKLAEQLFEIALGLILLYLGLGFYLFAVDHALKLAHWLTQPVSRRLWAHLGCNFPGRVLTLFELFSRITALALLVVVSIGFQAAVLVILTWAYLTAGMAVSHTIVNQVKGGIMKGLSVFVLSLLALGFSGCKSKVDRALEEAERQQHYENSPEAKAQLKALLEQERRGASEAIRNYRFPDGPTLKEPASHPPRTQQGPPEIRSGEPKEEK